MSPLLTDTRLFGRRLAAAAFSGQLLHSRSLAVDAGLKREAVRGLLGALQWDREERYSIL